MLQYIISWHRKSETGLGSFEYGGCSGDFAFFIDTPRSLEGDTFEAKNTALHDPENLTVTDGLIGATLLQHAAIQAHHDLTRLIVSKEGVNLNDCGQIHGLTPPLISCMQGDMYLVRYFLDGGASVQGRDALCGRTVLHFLSQFTDYALMKQVCEEAIRCCIDINSTDNDGRNPLHATFIGLDRSEGEAAKLLLEMGCNPVASDSLGFSPLELAARNFDLHLVKRILKFAPAFERSVPGQVTKVTKIKGKILSTILRNPPFYRMVILGRDRLLPRTKELLDIVRSQDTLDFMFQYDQQRLSLLALAINVGSTDIAEHLIPESQLDVSDNDGRTALHWAIESRSLHVARLLLQHHADPLVPDKKKTTPMHLAARYAPSFQEELAAHIYQLRSLKFPADCLSTIDAKDDIGWTPFLTALLEGTKEHIDCAERLRQKYGIPYDEQAFRSDLFKLPPDCHLSPVGLFTSMASSMKEALLALTHLLSLDPLPNFVCSNRNGLTLFHVVMATSVLGNYILDGVIFLLLTMVGPWGLDVTKLLLRKYPTQQDKGSGNDDGQTPLHWAAAFVNFDAAERFIQDAVNNRQTLDYNPVAGTETPLDYLGRNKQFHKIRYWQKEAQQYEDIVHRDILKLFDMFRCRGAATSLERTGLPLLYVLGD
jgi:ankyrin repeat protein